jgi:membrane fusion protein
MNRPLFRKQATEFQNNRLHGEILITPKASQLSITVIILFFVATILVWLISSTYAKKESVTGWLEPKQGIVKIYPNNSVGKVKEIFVNNGEAVTKGQPLMIINGDRILADGANLEEQLLGQYEKQRQLLERQLIRANELHTIRKNELIEQIESAMKDKEQIKSQVLLTEKRLKLAENQNEVAEQMHRQGHVSKLELNNSKETALVLASELQSVLREQRSLNNQAKQLQTDLTRLPKEQANEVDRINQSLGELSQNIDQLRGQRAYIVKASSDGIVSNLQASLGQQTTSTMPLLSILPTSQTMTAKLLLPIRAAGFINEGQSIDIRYDAFPYQKYGLHKGKIDRVSTSILLPNELGSSPVAVDEPVYLVQANIVTPILKASAIELPLKSGMTFTADIKIKDRTLLEWLFEPILSLRGKI